MSIVLHIVAGMAGIIVGLIISIVVINSINNDTIKAFKDE